MNVNAKDGTASGLLTVSLDVVPDPLWQDDGGHLVVWVTLRLEQRVVVVVALPAMRGVGVGLTGKEDAAATTTKTLLLWWG